MVVEWGEEERWLLLLLSTVEAALAWPTSLGFFASLL